jgi:hypothetical protein
VVAETPTLYVCHGDDGARGGIRVAACRRHFAAGIEYEKVIAAHGHPIPFLGEGARDELREATGDTKLPVLKLPDGDNRHALSRHPGLDLAAKLIRPARPGALNTLDPAAAQRPHFARHRRIDHELGLGEGARPWVRSAPRSVGPPCQDALAISDTHLPKAFFFVP